MTDYVLVVDIDFMPYRYLEDVINYQIDAEFFDSETVKLQVMR